MLVKQSKRTVKIINYKNNTIIFNLENIQRAKTVKNSKKILLMLINAIAKIYNSQIF